MLKILHKINKTIDKIVYVFLVAVFILMAVVALIQVFYRFVLQHPLTWTDELCRYALIWLTLLSIGVATKRKSHISIDLIKNALSGKALKVFEKFWNLCAIVLCVVIVKYGMELVTLNMVQFSAGMHLRLGYVYYALPVGGILIIYYSLLQLFGLDQKLEEMDREEKM